MFHSLVMILIGFDSDERLDVIEYTFISGCWDLNTPVTLMVDTWLWGSELIKYFALNYPIHASMLLLIPNIMIYLKNLTEIHDIYLVTILFMLP